MRLTGVTQSLNNMIYNTFRVRIPNVDYTEFMEFVNKKGYECTEDIDNSLSLQYGEQENQECLASQNG